MLPSTLRVSRPARVPTRKSLLVGRCYHTSPTTQRSEHRVPNPFSPAPSIAPRSKISLFDVVDSASSRAPNPYEPIRPRNPPSARDSKERAKYSLSAPLDVRKEDVRAWLDSKSTRPPGESQERTFPLDEVKEVDDVAHFELLAQEGQAGAPEAMLLLAKSHMILEKSDMPLAEQRRGAAKVEASRILTWVLDSDRRYWDLTLPVDFLRSLSWHLEAEGKGQVLLDWLTTWSCNPEMRSGAIKAFHPPHRNTEVTWPGNTLVELLNARAYWAEDRTANTALECALFALEHLDGEQVYIPTALMNLERQLLTDEALPCSPELYEMFLARLPAVRGWRNMSTPTSVQAHLADLHLYHPSKANADLWLRLCHDDMLTIARNNRSKLNRASHLLRAAYLLRLEGEDEGATLLEDLSQDLHQKPWSIRQYLYTRYRADPKLRNQHLRSPHTKALETRHSARV